jgi:hypothetical protein
MHPCFSFAWFEKLGLVVLQFLQSPEGSRTITAIAGLLVILYHVRQGTVPGGRFLAALLTTIFVVALSAIALVAVASLEASLPAKCSAYAVFGILLFDIMWQKSLASTG